MKKIVLTVLITALFGLSIWAVPAKKGQRIVKQSDGTELAIQLIGDEHTHYWATEDGYPVILTQDGNYEYALRKDNQWISSLQVAKAPQLRSDEEWKILKNINQQNKTIAQTTPKRAKVTAKRATRPAHGTKNLVILMAYKDKAFTVSNPKQAFTDLLNKKDYNSNGATGSVKDYFTDASNSKFTPQFDVYGPYTAAKNLSYYGQNDANGYDMHVEELIKEACQFADADGVDFTQYDSDNDGCVDNVSIFYAGYSEAEWAPENTIWPHQYYLSETYNSITLDGKKIDSYVCMNELKGEKGSDMCGIGTFCHEFSHSMGLPDLYATDGSEHNTVGTWDVMDMGPYNNDGCTPPTYSAYERFFMGWLTPTVISQYNTLQLENLQTSNKAYMITSTGTHNLDGVNPNPTTFYLLENRQQQDWDAHLPGHGMLITRINYSESKWYNNTVNNSSRSMGVDIMEADGRSSVEGDSGDTYPSGATYYTPYSTYPITNIQESNGVISFTFMTKNEENDNPNDNPGGTPSGDCFTETFSNLTANESVDIAQKLDTYCDNTGWSGEKIYAAEQGLKMGSSKVGGTITSPRLGQEGDVQVSVLLENYNNDITTVTLSLIGEGTLSTTSISCASSEQYFTIKGCTPNTQITFSTKQGKQRFYLYSLEACTMEASDIVTTQSTYTVATQPSLITITNAPMGEARLYNLMGQLTQRKTLEDGTCEFSTSQGIYLLVIYDNAGKICATEKIVCP